MIPDGIADTMLNKMDDSLTSFFYENKIALVPDRKHVKLITMLTNYAKTLNVNVETFHRVRDAKAWLLDDKFMVFQTILSEKRMDQVIKAIELEEEAISDDGRPDIAMIFSSDPDTTSAVDVVVVEIKKKTSDEKENSYAINQLLQRAEKLVKHCSNIQRIWYYAVLEVNDSLATRLRQQKWAPLFSKGKVFYQEFETPDADNRYIPTPTFIMSFDAIVNDAETRNHTFLEILKEGMRKYA